MKKFLFFLLLVATNIKTYAQETPETLINSFFQEYSKNPVKAVETLYARNPWASRQKDAIEQVKSEIGKLTPDYVGKYYGYETLVKKNAGTSFFLYSYLVKYERQPLRFTFEFYKANDKWAFFSFNLDSNIDDELEEGAKLNYIIKD